jgi:purine-binding chemotaxis protein CheW
MNGPSKSPAGPIDWAAVRARLQKADAALAEALDPSPKRAQAIMKARAEALARAQAPSRSPGSHLDVVLFGLGRERYAIETRFVCEVVRFVDFTPVPRTPDYIVGVANLRGTVLAVVDLRRFFNIPRSGITDLFRIVVLGTDGVELGILADGAHGQAEIAADALLPPPGKVSGIGHAYIRGVTRDALIVLDGAVLLGDQRLFVGGETEPDA